MVVGLCLVSWLDGVAGCSIALEPTRTSFVTAVSIGSAGPFRFLVDTGATMTVIDRAVAERIGLQPAKTVNAVGSTGSFQTQEATVDELRAGSVSLTNAKVLIADLPRFANHGRLDGILGMSFFAGRAVLFDVRRRCVELDVPRPRGDALEAHEVVGRVAIKIEGLNFILDSGASFPVLMSPAARALASEEGAYEITSAAGRRQATAATIHTLRIGGMTFRDVAAVVAPARDPREDALLPITPFASVYIAADRKSVVVQ